MCVTTSVVWDTELFHHNSNASLLISFSFCLHFTLLLSRFLSVFSLLFLNSCVPSNIILFSVVFIVLNCICRHLIKTKCHIKTYYDFFPSPCPLLHDQRQNAGLAALILGPTCFYLVCLRKCTHSLSVGNIP